MKNSEDTGLIVVLSGCSAIPALLLALVFSFSWITKNDAQSGLFMLPVLAIGVAGVPLAVVASIVLILFSLRIKSRVVAFPVTVLFLSILSALAFLFQSGLLVHE